MFNTVSLNFCVSFVIALLQCSSSIPQFSVFNFRYLLAIMPSHSQMLLMLLITVAQIYFFLLVKFWINIFYYRSITNVSLPKNLRKWGLELSYSSLFAKRKKKNPKPQPPYKYTTVLNWNCQLLINKMSFRKCWKKCSCNDGAFGCFWAWGIITSERHLLSLPEFRNCVKFSSCVDFPWEWCWIIAFY